MAQDNIIKFTDLVDKANTILSKHTVILGDAADNLELLNTKYKELPSQYYNAVKKNLDVQERKEQSDKKLIRLEEQHNKAIKSKIPTLTQLVRLKKAEELATTRANKALNESVNTYNKIQAKIKAMIPVYNDLAAKQQLGIKLTAKEDAQLTLLTNRLTKYRGALNQVNKDYGNYSLEVGNYAQGTKNLQFSIAQISRELPNFGQSFQIGVLSLTNNIGFLLDGIKQVKAQNIELKAQGKATQSVFKTILGSFFSFQTLLFVGIGLFSAYSKEISNFAKSLFESNDALKSNVSYLKDMGEETNQSIGRLSTLVSVIQDVTLSDEDRLRALKDLNEEYPELNYNISLEESNMNALNLAVSEYIDLLIKKAKLKSLEEKIGEATIKQVKLEERRKEIEEEYFKLIADGNRDKNYLNNIQKIYTEALKDEAENRKKLNDLTTASVGLTDKEGKLIKGTIQYYEDLISVNNKLIREKKTINDLDEVRRLQSENEQWQKQIDLIENRKKREKEQKREKEVSVLSDLSKGTETYRTEIEKLISALEQAQALEVKGSKTYNELGEAVKNLKDSLDPLADIAKRGNDEIQRGIEIDKEKAKELYNLQKATEKYMKTFESDFFKGAGLGSLEQFFDGSFDKLLEGSSEKWAVYFNGITEVAQEAFNFIANQTQQNFDSEYAILEKRKEIALQFAGESAAAKERIEEQYEAKRKAIQIKQAKAQQKLAIFNTVINTAQAVVSAIAASPLTLGMPWAGIIAGIGLAQAAFIANQDIPEFKDGVRNFGGGAAIVGDGGVSEIVRTDKGVYATPNKDTLVNLPKGADVFKNHDEYFNSVMNDMGILPSIQKVEASNGLKASEVDAIMGKYFSKIQINELNFDKRGFGMSIKKTNSRTILKNNRASAKGYSV